MARSKKHVGLVLGASLVLAAVRTFLVTTGMEKNAYETHTYYLADTAVNKVFTVASVVAVLFFLLLALKNATGSRFEFDLKNSTFAGASSMLAFILLGAVFIFAFIHVSQSVKPSGIGLTVAVFSVLSAFSFLLPALRVCSKNLLAVMGLFPIILSAARLLGDFIRTSATPFASSGAYHISGLALVMIYFYCEGKSFVNGGSAAIYLASGYASVILLLVYSVPNLVLHCIGVFSFDYYAAYSAVDLLTAVYICARISSVHVISKKKDLAMMLQKASAK